MSGVMNTSKPATREDWVDIAKGIGIVLVVIGHIHAYTGSVKAFIYMFHMPLFFFISGYLSSVRKDYRSYLVDKSISLLVPYAVFVILLASRDIAKRALAGQTDEALWGLETMFLGGEVLQGWAGTAWFIACLFFTQQLMNYVLSRFGMRVAALVSAALLALGYVETWLFPDFWLPLALNIVAGAAPFYFLGHAFKQASTQGNAPRAVKLSALAVMVLASVLLARGLPLALDMKVAQFGIPVLSLLVACAFIVGLFELSRFMAHRKWLAAPLMQLGEASLVIMFLHVPIYIVMENKLQLTSGLPILGVALALPYCAYLLLKTNTLTRALFLGSRRDWQKLVDSRHVAHKRDPAPGAPI